MITTFVKHTVTDYSKWRAIYDEFQSVAKENGVLGESVFRDPNSPKDVIVTHDFKDFQSANSFLESDNLKSAMQNAGVSGVPEIWFGEKV